MIAAATMMAFFVEDNTSLSVLLFNASAETYLVLSYTIGCNISHRLGVSSAYICGLLAGFYKVFLQVGKVLSAALLTASPTVQVHHAIVGTAIVLLTVAASIVLVQDRDIVERFNFKQLSIDPANAAYKSLSERYALTPKEASVKTSRGNATPCNSHENACSNWLMNPALAVAGILICRQPTTGAGDPKSEAERIEGYAAAIGERAFSTHIRTSHAKDQRRNLKLIDYARFAEELLGAEGEGDAG